MNIKIFLQHTKSDFMGLPSIQMIELPVAEDSLNKIMKLLEADAFESREYIFVGYQASFQELYKPLKSIDEIVALNELAAILNHWEDNLDKRDTYKALLERFRPDDIQDAIKLTESVDKYTVLDEDIRNCFQLGEYLVDSGIVEIDEDEYCDYEEIGCHFDAYLTSYGFLCEQADLERR